jgi:hypothetical protein
MISLRGELLLQIDEVAGGGSQAVGEKSRDEKGGLGLGLKETTRVF